MTARMPLIHTIALRHACRVRAGLAMVLWFAATLAHAPLEVRAQTGGGAPDRLAVVSDHRGECENMTVIDVDRARTEFTSRGLKQKTFWGHPGHMAATRDMGLVAALPADWSGSMLASDTGPTILQPTPGRRPPDNWSEVLVPTVRRPLASGGIAFTANDDHMLMATQGDDLLQIWPLPPYGVAKFDRSRFTAGTPSFGPELGWLETGLPVAEILPDAEGRLAHLVLAPSVGLSYDPVALVVATIDVATMQEVAARVTLPPMLPTSDGSTYDALEPSINTRAALAPDGRHVVVSLWLGRALGVVDLVTRRAWSIPTPELDLAGGLAINYGPANAGLLALQDRRRLALYRWTDGTSLPLVGMIDPLPVTSYALYDLSHLAWTGDGQVLLATSGFYPSIEAWSVTDGGRRAARIGRWNTCLPNGNIPQDIVTNNRLPLATPDELASPTAPASPTAFNTPTRSASTTPSPAPTDTGTPMETATTIPESRSTPPSLLYMPLALREPATRKRAHIDVVLVLDTSSSMAGPKLAAARRAVAGFIDALASLDGPASDRLRGDRFALVTFDGTAPRRIALTDDPTGLPAVLAGLVTSEGTRIDLGLATAVEVLRSGATPGNTPVIVLITDGRPSGLPEDAIALAAAARAGGTTVLAIGFGEDADLAYLGQLTSGSTGVRFAPTADELESILRYLAREIPCGENAFWGRRC